LQSQFRLGPNPTQIRKKQLKKETFLLFDTTLFGLGTQFKLNEIWSHLVFGIQHERWSGWGVTENRAMAYWEFHPISSLSLSIGYTYRSPQFVSLGIQSLSWPSVNTEWEPLYRLQWKLLENSALEVGKFGASILVWNYDRMRLATSDNIHFSLIPEYCFAQKSKVQVIATTAVKGFSGAVVSWDQLDLGIGLKYDF
jgi:hypothetical protein